jgi:hypothetical protein
MELLGKIYFLFKIAVFALLIWKYGFNGFEKYNKDFDNYYSTFIEPHIESILAFTAGSTVGISEILRTHQADLSGLFFFDGYLSCWGNYKSIVDCISHFLFY